MIETASLSEEEFSQYCRRKAFIQQAASNKLARLSAQCRPGKTAQKSQADQKQIKKLERELRHKEKALAETAALLVLRKKLDALWEDDNGDD